MQKLRTRILPSGDVKLYDQRRPKLHAGRYKLRVEQDVQYKSTEHIRALAEQVFHVKGQYFLDQNNINTHPPNNSKGQFGDILPHLTLAKPGLLWEKELDLPGNEGDKLPWLALLVLRESEWTGDGKPQKGTISQFQHNTDRSLFVPVLKDVFPEELDTLCQFTEIPVQTFKDFMPKIGHRGLRHFTGARTNPADEKQGMSVITAHRFPVVDMARKDGNQFIVYLISLEGLEPCLQGIWPSEISRVRMLCLHHWTFTSYPDEGESFRELLTRLLENTNAENIGRSDTWLRYPKIDLPVGTDQYIQQRLADGYVPLVYHTRAGE